MISTSDSVLIVGAGPTGLTLACALAGYGIPFTIVDRKSGPSNESKGLAVNIACEYLFDLLGMPMQPGPGGCRLHRLNILWQGRKFSAIDFRRLDFPITYLISQPQPDTECQLEQALQERGGRVRWQTEVLGLEAATDGVLAHLRAADGSLESTRFAYVVGCDGKFSMVRDYIGASMVGHGYPMHFVLGDFDLNWDGEPEQVYYHVYPQDFFILVPLGGKRWRVVVKHDGDVPADTPLTDSAVTEPVTRLLGRDIFIGPSSWISRAPFYGRVADRMQQGRCFIAGDSAHLVSPIGGTGMNAGMQDAFNLAWKLALHARGLAPDTLLTSYEPERLEAVRANGAATDLNTRLISRLETDPAPLQPLLPIMQNRARWRREVPQQFSGLAQSYSDGLLSAGGPGSRAGKFYLSMHSLLNLLRRHGAAPAPAALCLVTRWSRSLGMERLQALAQRYAAQLHAVLLTGGDASEPQTAAPALARVELDPQTMPVEADRLLLLRPDGVVAFDGTHAEFDRLAALLEKWFTPSPSLAGQH